MPGQEIAAEWIGGPAWLRLDLLLELALATLLGGAVGFEREYSGKPAGLRTNILICVGAALLTELSISIAAVAPHELIRADPARIAAQIVSGIGFLGAGTIIQARGSVTGLTTAATLWVVAAIGMAAGSGAYTEAVGATVLVLFTLVLLGRLEDAVLASRVRRGLRVQLLRRSGIVGEILAELEEAGLEARCDEVRAGERDDLSEAFFEVRGAESLFREARARLLDREEVRGVRLE